MRPILASILLALFLVLGFFSFQYFKALKHPAQFVLSLEADKQEDVFVSLSDGKF